MVAGEKLCLCWRALLDLHRQLLVLVLMLVLWWRWRRELAVVKLGRMALRLLLLRLLLRLRTAPHRGKVRHAGHTLETAIWGIYCLGVCVWRGTDGLKTNCNLSPTISCTKRAPNST